MKDPRDAMNLRQVVKFILVFGSALFCSCAHYPCDPAYAGPKTRSDELLVYYSYPTQKVEATVKTVAKKKHYVIEQVEFPSARNVFNKENIKVDFYVQRKEGKFPTILIWPIRDDADFCVRGFAKHFASNGFNCAVIHNRDVDLDKIASAEELEDCFRQTVLDAGQVIDYLVERKEVDDEKLGALGLSLGGIRACIVSAVEQRIKCSVIALAGGSMADITLGSEWPDIRDYVKELAKMGASPDVIRAELSNKVETDPLALAEYLNARSVLMYIAAFDHVIPTQCGDRLWKAMGKPEVVYLFSGHLTSLLYMPCIERESLSFFRRKLQVQ
jgi:dienelactone hydrolase